MKILVTGAVGFIGAALSRVLVDRGDQVVGVDDLNAYYDVNLKKARLERLTSSTQFLFQKLDISDRDHISDLFSSSDFDVVVNLAAQAGVRYSIENPSAYVDTNLVGFGNILEGCRDQEIDHLVYASSSSVYGSNTKLPFAENDRVDQPISLYGATKKANELMAHAYADLYQLPTTGLRFFTVYGPWGRPDMALFKFTKGILKGEPIPVYNRGEMIRDFTYIDDIVEGVVRAIDRPPLLDADHENNNDPAVRPTPYQIYNIGNGHPVPLMRYIQALEKALGKKAQLELLPMQPGDVRATEADVSRLVSDLGYRPQIDVETGITRFVEWYCDYYDVQRSD
ncbi:MAG TPA: NAD-dependent epimerase [Gammaproteobacteria bacterium]|nr:NAD-dependent epimerase [Gammaproteobacteria bacterium]